MRTALALATVLVLPTGVAAPLAGAVPDSEKTGLAFIDTSFENASPLWYETRANGTILVHLLYDHERSSPNRAAGHILSRLEARPGASITLEENDAPERWLEEMIAAGRRPHLALEMHNDGGGNLHVSRPARPGQQRHLARMAVLERLLPQHTWFTEGSVPPSAGGSATLGDGWLERYDVDAAVHELNCNWIAGLRDYPSARHWKAYGASLARVFYDYLGAVAP